MANIIEDTENLTILAVVLGILILIFYGAKWLKDLLGGGQKPDGDPETKETAQQIAQAIKTGRFIPFDGNWFNPTEAGAQLAQDNEEYLNKVFDPVNIAGDLGEFDFYAPEDAEDQVPVQPGSIAWDPAAWAQKVGIF